MKKLQKLHEYLLGTGLVKVSQLRTFADQGRILFFNVADGSADVSLRRDYQAQITITDYAGDPDKLDIALCWWLAMFEPRLIGAANGYGFEAESKGKETTDLHLIVPLSEWVRYDGTTETLNNCNKPTLQAEGIPLIVPVFIRDELTQMDEVLVEVQANG